MFAVNKSDRPGANLTKRELVAMVSAKPLAPGQWRPPVVPIVATTGQGIADLVDTISAHRAAGEASGAAAERRRARVAAQITALADEQLQRAVAQQRTAVDLLAADVLAGRTDAYQAARAVLSALGWSGG